MSQAAPRADAPAVLVLLKPDAVDRRLGTLILSKLRRAGVHVSEMALVRRPESPSTPFGRDKAAFVGSHYREHSEKPFFPNLAEYMCDNVFYVAFARGDPKAARGVVDEVRRQFKDPQSTNTAANLVHASDSAEEGQRETALWRQFADKYPTPSHYAELFAGMLRLADSDEHASLFDTMPKTRLTIIDV